MIDCVILGYGQPVNLVGGQPITLTSSPNWTVTSRGPAGNVSGGNGFQIPFHGSRLNSACTIRVLFKMVATPGGTFTSLWDTSDSSLRLYINTTGDIQFTNFGGGGSVGSVTLGMTAGNVYDLVVQDTLASGGQVYLNGVLTGGASSLTNYNSTTESSVPFCLGPIPTGNTAGQWQYITCQLWKRVLTGSEIRRLYADPYCFLASDTIAIKTATAAATTVFRRTLSPLGTRTGSRQAII